VTNLGPGSVAEGDLRFSLNQDTRPLSAVLLGPTGTFTGYDRCFPFGESVRDGTWGGICHGVDLAPGQYLSAVFEVTYPSPPSLTGFAEGYDLVRGDPDRFNNVAADSTHRKRSRPGRDDRPTPAMPERSRADLATGTAPCDDALPHCRRDRF
jgi:hypothetical protein